MVMSMFLVHCPARLFTGVHVQSSMFIGEEFQIEVSDGRVHVPRALSS